MPYQRYGILARSARKEELETCESNEGIEQIAPDDEDDDQVEMTEYYIDDGYENQSCLFEDMEEERFYSHIFSRAQSLGEAQKTQQTPEPFWSCYPLLQPDELIVPGQVYRLPSIEIVELSKHTDQSGNLQPQLQQPPVQLISAPVPFAPRGSHEDCQERCDDAPRPRGLSSQLRKIFGRMSLWNFFRNERN